MARTKVRRLKVVGLILVIGGCTAVAALQATVAALLFGDDLLFGLTIGAVYLGVLAPFVGLLILGDIWRSSEKLWKRLAGWFATAVGGLWLLSMFLQM